MAVVRGQLSVLNLNRKFTSETHRERQLTTNNEQRTPKKYESRRSQVSVSAGATDPERQNVPVAFFIHRDHVLRGTHRHVHCAAVRGDRMAGAPRCTLERA